jgi:hypothetical protein
MKTIDNRYISRRKMHNTTIVAVNQLQYSPLATVQTREGLGTHIRTAFNISSSLVSLVGYPALACAYLEQNDQDFSTCILNQLRTPTIGYQAVDAIALTSDGCMAMVDIRERNRQRGVVDEIVG